MYYRDSFEDEYSFLKDKIEEYKKMALLKLAPFGIFDKDSVEAFLDSYYEEIPNALMIAEDSQLTTAERYALGNEEEEFRLELLRERDDARAEAFQAFLEDKYDRSY